MYALAAVLAVAALTAGAGAGADAFRLYGPPGPAPPTTVSPEEACHLPCTCRRLSRWTQRMRAHCRVLWQFEPFPHRHFLIDTSVDEVDFTNSRIRKLYAGHLVGLEHIKVMRMEGVNLVSVTTNAFYELSDLWSLSLARNHLASLPQQAFERSHRLHHLSLRGNPLTATAGQPLVSTPSLLALDVADCRITAVDSATFRQLPNLRQLHLEGNSLVDLPADAVAPMAHLTHLFLQANRLLFFPSAAIKKLPELLQLHLDNNTQMEGPLGPLEAPKLQRLSATGCSLESVQPNLLATAPELRYLRLAGNRVRALWLANEAADAQLVLLDMTGNPLQCDCALRDASMWADEHVHEARVFCGEPPRSWHDAQLHRLNCTQSQEPTTGAEAGASTDSISSGGGGGEAGAAVLWASLSLVVVLVAVGGGLLFIYRYEVFARFFSPEGRAAASGGIDVMPLERNHTEDVAIGLPHIGMAQEGGVAPWLEQ